MEHLAGIEGIETFWYRMIYLEKKELSISDAAGWLVTVVFLLFTISCTDRDRASDETDFAQYVDPFIGTGGSGHTFPGAAFPMGMVQLSPNTGNFGWDYHSGYQFRDSTLRGFAHTHLSGGGNPVLGDVLVLPFASEKALQDQSVPFSKAAERASPGYYSTELTSDGIRVELTVTPRTGMHRYTFMETGPYHLLINLDEVLYSGNPEKSKVNDAYFQIENDSCISGYQRSYVKRVDRPVFFTMRFSRPFTGHRYLDEAGQRKLVLDYSFGQDEQLEIRVALSTVSIEGAKKNLHAESLGRSFEEIRISTVQAWNHLLSKITIEGSREQKEQFYTSLYHLFIQPNNIADVDGRYRGADDSIHQAPASGEMYSTFAFWDTYRAANPLYTILIPDRVGTFVNSVLRHHDEKGYLPVWPLWGRDSRTMIGNHSVPVIVDACLKAIPGINPEKAFEAIHTTLTRNSWHKYDWTLYDCYGYLPFDTVLVESVSRTLEATYDDWCAAQLARALNKTEEYEFFIGRAARYKNLYDTATCLMRGKDRNGRWRQPFDPLEISNAWSGPGDFTEANAWQYTWHVQHDVLGLMELMGGKDNFAARLDTLFSMHSRKVGSGSLVDVSGLIGQYAHGNEPSQHVAYLYNYAGKPHRTQEMVHQILQTLYATTPEGYCGNNDFGQMSAWYIFSSLGFYPVNPASGVFDIGLPQHRYASINLDGNPFVVKAEDLSPDNKYVRALTLNGKAIEYYQITYDDIRQGGELVFEMTDLPQDLK